MEFTARRPSKAFLISLAVLLSLLHAVLAVTASSGKSTTADEIVHLTAGHAYNTRNDYRLHPENGNLSQRWAALPLLIAHVQLPPTTLPSWSVAHVWDYGYIFFYAQGLSADELLWLGRGMIALISGGLGLLVFFWSRNLFGWAGGFISLALYAFCPSFLAHGALATSDLMMTFFFVSSVGAWWRHLENPGLANAALSALTLGLAFVAKFSAILLPPMLGIIALVWAASRASTTGWRKGLLRLARTTVGHGVVTVGIIWLFYGFRSTPFAPDLAGGAQFNRSWDWLLNERGWPADIIWTLKTHRILPEAWLYGLSFVMKFSDARGAFLNGEYSVNGWVWFFPFAFIAKTTIAFLLICLVVFGSGLRALTSRLRSGQLRSTPALLRPVTPLLVLFFVYGIFSLTSHLNIGHRHLLPIYPVLFIAAGSLGRWMGAGRPVAAGLALTLVGWHAFESLRIRPHYLAYFNQLV
ncbi:MAG: glycosyltransferase family 39 protein, partial [Opitutaceae bacterium]